MKLLFRLLAVIACSVLLATPGMTASKEAIKTNVDAMVAAINEGKAATSFAADTYTPYVFVMATNGQLIVHPYLKGEYLQEKASPVYAALQKATKGGVWVTYFWKGAEKETYARRTDNDLIVGSGQ